MRNRKNTNVALLAIILVAIIVLWIFRTQPPSQKSAGRAESSEARVGPADIYPDPLRTPGSTNPGITQENVRETICNPRWSTKSIRPPASYTNRLKVEQIREYGYSDSTLKDFEEDHFIPLELGGNPTDSKNLWPEPFETSIPDGASHFNDKISCAAFGNSHGRIFVGFRTRLRKERQQGMDGFGKSSLGRRSTVAVQLRRRALS